MTDTLLIAAWLAGFFIVVFGGLALAGLISDLLGWDE